MLTSFEYVSSNLVNIEIKLSSEPNTSHNNNDSRPLMPTRLYMEKQEKAFCLVHAFNMALGRHALDGNRTLEHISQLEQTLIS